METADVIVIGSGQGGVPFATDFAKAGQNVVLSERDVLGGSCMNYGCTAADSQTLLANGDANSCTKLMISISSQEMNAFSILPAYCPGTQNR